MISCPAVSKQVIRNHYDLTTLFYRLFWGPHIHHGLWTESESPCRAQLQLTERLAEMAGLKGGERVIDIGCGMGGSSIHLAKKLNCNVTGITISRVQRQWATAAAFLQRVSSRTKFVAQDAEQVEFPGKEADLVWSIECTEHLFDKPRFFQRAASWLKPGGRLSICAWLAGSNLNDSQQKQVYDVCEGFFCPSLGTAENYQQWMTEAGLEMRYTEDWTERVSRTWEICRDRVNRSGVRWIAKFIDRDQAMFLDRFQTILDAYHSGAMAYGAFVARKPE
jgi:tocopherol O-methyltransferase